MSVITAGKAPGQGIEPGSPHRKSLRELLENKLVRYGGGSAAVLLLLAAGGAATHVLGPKPANPDAKGDKGTGFNPNAANPPVVNPETPAAAPSPTEAPAAQTGFTAQELCQRLGGVLAKLTGVAVNPADCRTDTATGVLQEIDGQTANGQYVSIALIDADVAGPQTDHIGQTYAGYGRLPDFLNLPKTHKFNVTGTDGTVHSAGWASNKGEIGVGAGTDPSQFVLISAQLQETQMHQLLADAANALSAHAS